MHPFIPSRGVGPKSLGVISYCDIGGRYDGSKHRGDVSKKFLANTLQSSSFSS